jgi:alpha-1,4-digalacturonate transport system substrate-binding protein
LLPKFEQDDPDIKVVIDKQAYKAILESLPVQLAAGHGPDIARTTDFGIISQYFLDLRPLLKDPALPWRGSASTAQLAQRDEA